MNLYTVNITRRAAKELEDLPGSDYERVKSEILALKEQPRPPRSLKLRGRDGWRIRIGDYRVIYEILDKELLVLVIKVAHRRDIYKKK